MPIFIFLHLKSWFLFTDFLLKTYFHLVCFDVLLLPQFLPDHLHFPSCQSLCSFLSFKTNKNKRNTCTLPSSRWKCKQKTNKIKKYASSKMRQEVHKNINAFVLRWPITLGLEGLSWKCDPYTQGDSIGEKGFSFANGISCRKLFGWGGGSLCLHPRELRRASVEELPRSGPSAGKCLDCAWVLLKY